VTTEVINVRDQKAHRAANPDREYAYIGRGSPWGNPFVMRNKSDKERARVIEEFTRMLKNDPEAILAARRKLRGKVLVCFCAPLPCHGDVLARVAEGGNP